MPFINNKYSSLYICLSLIIVTGMVYWQVGQFEFLDWDDELYVTDNKNVQAGLTVKSIGWAFTTLHATNWHPLTWLSHMLDVQLFGLDSGWHHITNVIFHIASSLLLFLLLRRMTGGLWQSAFVAAMFALHPLHVESVAWVAERKDVLSAFFGMLTLYSYALYSERPGISRYLLVVLCFVLGLMSKPMLVTLPFLLLMLDYWPLRRFSGRPLRHLIYEKIPLLMLTIASCVITYIAQSRGGAVTDTSGVSVHGEGHAVTFYIGMGERISNALVSYISYLGKTFYPQELIFFYPFRDIVPGWQVAASGLLIVILSALAVLLIKRAPYLFVGWFWFVGTLVPVIGLVQVGWQSMADRYTYIPLIGIFIIIAWGVPDLLGHWKRSKAVLTAAMVVTVLVSMVLTSQQVAHWRNRMALYEHALKIAPEVGFVQFKVGSALVEQGRLEESQKYFREALRLQPYNIRARYNLGLALFQQNKFKLAIEQFSELIRIFPSFEPAQRRLNMAQAMLNRIEAQAVSNNPVMMHMQQGMALEKQGRFDVAVEAYKQALQQDQELVGAHQRLGLIFHQLRRIDEAVYHYSALVRLQPKSAGAHYNLGLALVDQGQVEKAIEHYRHALGIKPDFAEVHNNLGVALFRLESTQAAIDSFKAALRIRPDYVQAKTNLDKVLAENFRIIQPR
ncbi:Tetratricopeptide TPR_2 repeat protein [hydrothermal vent metagenome]|uniref:Tetratricopeptide TPR_2 repeat protein n=1 Tax=hydrothermal vent metagenome TaxID=652676 RepID=A0A3B1AV38_9ZZZZ